MKRRTPANDFAHGRRNRRTGNAEFRERSEAEDEDGVQPAIGEHHGARTDGEDPGTKDRHEKRAEKKAEKGDGQRYNAPEHVAASSLLHFLRMNALRERQIENPRSSPSRAS